MASPLSFITADALARDLGRDLVGGGDSFAVTIASRLDRRFWVRVERELEGDAVVVTDFVSGERPRAELAAGIAMAIRAVSVSGRARGLAFRDLVPAGAQAPLFPARLVQAADFVKHLSAAVAENLATAVASFEMTPQRGKIDARVTFTA